jgi:predicted CXXCH cytochrome family protein
MTGHKNMLRKVTAGEIWAGPDGVSYQTTGWALGTIDFTATPPTATNPSVPWTYPLLYVFGDWMAPAPDALDVIVAIDATTARYNGTNTYSCASCHATGWSNPSAGICVQGAVAKPTSGTGAVTTEAACLALVPAGVWYPMTGVEGAIASYFTTGAKEPGASFPSMAQPNGTINGITGKWDRDGIMCSRCHYTVFAKNGTNAPGTAFTAPAGTGTHNVTPATTANQQVTGICFGCHQSIGKVSNGTGTDTDLGNPALNITVTNRLTAPAYQPDFSSHPIANQFLNSPHAEYTVPVGSNGIVPNNLGKFNLVGNLETQYASAFKGFVCRSSATAGGGSILATVWKGGAVEEIKTQDDCNLANGQPAGTVGYWQTENRGACTTCHDVHQSLFDPAATEAVRKECETCHTDNTGTGGAGYNAAGVPQINPALVNHLKGAGTPWDTTEYKEPCEACHMPKASAAGFPIHLWRINSDPSYSTFPSAADFIGNVKKNGNVDVNGKMWVDIDLACGKCHGGGTVQDAQHQPKVALCTAPGVPEACCSGPGSGTCAQYRTKLELAGVAEGIHDSAAASYQVTFTASVTDLTVNVDATVDCGGACPTLTYDWNWGDGTANGTADPDTHTYSTSGTKSITLTVKSNGVTVGTAARNVKVPVAPVDNPPVANATCTWDANKWELRVVDTSTDTDASPVATVVVDWNDLTSRSVGGPGLDVTHTYLKPGTAPGYTATLKAIDSALKMSSPPYSCAPVNPAYFTISGKVVRSDGTTPVASANVQVKRGTTVVKTVPTMGNGTFTAGSLKPGNYTLVVNKLGYTFTVPAAGPFDIGPDQAGLVIQATAP